MCKNKRLFADWMCSGVFIFLGACSSELPGGPQNVRISPEFIKVTDVQALLEPIEIHGVAWTFALNVTFDRKERPQDLSVLSATLIPEGPGVEIPLENLSPYLPRIARAYLPANMVLGNYRLRVTDGDGRPEESALPALRIVPDSCAEAHSGNCDEACQEWLGCPPEVEEGLELPRGVWAGLADSDFGPWSEFLTWSSATSGGIGYGTGPSVSPSVVLDSSGQPVVAWTGVSSGRGQIYVRRFDGTHWVEVGSGSATGGGISQSVGQAVAPSIILDASDQPIVAWSNVDSIGNSEIYVQRFDGTDWTDLGVGSSSGGGISNNGGASVNPALAIDSLGEPFVVWEDDSSGIFQIYIRCFDGAAWKIVGASSAGAGGLSATPGASVEADIAMGDDNFPWVVWQEGLDDGSGAQEIYLRRYNGSVWLDVGAGGPGGLGAPGGVSANPSLAINGSGFVGVVWEYSTPLGSEIYGKQYVGGAWADLGAGSASAGGISNALGHSQRPELAVDSDGNAVVVWNDLSSGAHEIYVKKFSNGSWAEFSLGSAMGGGISHTHGSSMRASFALDGAGRPVVAWDDDSVGAQEIYVRRFDGSEWSELGVPVAQGGAVSDSDGTSGTPSLGLDRTSQPVIAWADNSSGNYEIYVRKFEGTSWQPVGPGSVTGGGISNNAGHSISPSLSLDGSDLPVVAWEDSSSGTSEVYVKRFDGARWSDFGVGLPGAIVSTSSGSASAPSLALDRTGNPVVAWRDNGSGSWEIYVKRFSGGVWEELGVGSAIGGGISNTADSSFAPTLTLDAADRPVVAWQDNSSGNSEIYIKRYNGSMWEEVGVGSATEGGISDDVASSSRPTLVLDAAGHPIVAWESVIGGENQIYIKAFDGVDWKELGPSSGSGVGISDSLSVSLAPSLALDALGLPIVSWTDRTSGNLEIYIKRFDGAAWQELGAGSATGGGVSNSRGPSVSSSLARQGDRLCAAYVDAGALGTQIALRCAIP